MRGSADRFLAQETLFKHGSTEKEVLLTDEEVEEMEKEKEAKK